MTHLRFIRLTLMAAVTLMAATSCEKEDNYEFLLNPGESAGNNSSQSSPDSSISSSDYRAFLEVPKLKDDNLFVVHCVNYQGDSLLNYCLEYDPLMCHSRWVAFRFDALSRQQNVGRSDEPFIDDPAIPVKCQIGYNGFGNCYVDQEGNRHQLPSRQFDRGHLCASADRYLNREANEQTFYMSNMSPQMSNFNSPYWSSFEQYVQKRGRDASFADILYVVKGGTIEPEKILGYVERWNGAKVAIPKYYFMALLRCKDDTYSSIGFWMEHKDYGNRELSNLEIGDMVVSIDQLEELTGIDFFHNLPDNVETVVESRVVKSTWGL